MHHKSSSDLDRTRGGERVLLLSAKEAASSCGIRVRTWRQWDAAGKIPQAIRIGRTTMWRADDIRAWIKDGCPRRVNCGARS